jgi:FKBP-type peptidyl-prolyl cis-trans isomerase
LKRYLELLVILVIFRSFSFSQSISSNNSIDKNNMTFMDSVSYFYGIDIAKYFESLNNIHLKINNDLLIRGIIDYNNKRTFCPDTNRMKTILDAFTDLINEKIKENDIKEWVDLAKKNLEYSKKLLEDNKNQKNVIITKSGVQYRIIKNGSGKIPKINDTINVHITGKTMYDIEFINTKKRNKPVRICINTQIEGLKEILQKMPEGSLWNIIVPPDLAYGENGRGKNITSNNALIFEIELINVQ